MNRDEGPIGELEERLGRYPAGRYPVQHATAQFHLGVALAEVGDLARAEDALVTAVELFPPRALAAEHAKALNALGSVLRMAGRLAEAAQAFERAAAVFESVGLAAERGAAAFNLGLVRRDAGERDAAAGAFELARRLFDDARDAAHAAAAARELGTLHLARGALDAAREALEQSLATATSARDAAGAGTSANLLGLVELAACRPAAAAALFARAAQAHPRAIRPESHAMAKVNLALAHEREGDQARAHVAARQAIGVPAAPPAVREQAREVLRRVRGRPDDVVAVLEQEQPEQREAIVRDELARWLDAGDADRRAEAGAWIDGQLRRPAAAVALAESFVGGLLELPPDGLEAVVRAVVEALRERDVDEQARFRSEIASAGARFHVPQLMRLRDAFNRAAAELGEDPSWK